MLVIPAIDVKEGRCVRLRQGRMHEETVYADRPELMAVRWHEMGARRLHVVDLDGAVGGRPVNRDAIGRIVESVPIPVELGGGIRDLETLEAYFRLGVHFAILGTVACEDPAFVETACERYPGRIIVGIDARGGRVSVAGWTRDLALAPKDLAARMQDCGVAAVVYTDIFRDGMETGPNVEATRELARSVDIPVIASGGITTIDDVRALMHLEGDGVMGMITGRALYEGTLDLGEAVRVAGSRELDTAEDGITV